MTKTDREEKNRRLVVEFYEKCIAERKPELVEKYVSPNYKQHSTLGADGVAGLKDFLTRRKQTLPESKPFVKRSFVDGDHVVLHVFAIRHPGDRGLAIIDLFRVENDRVAEHWDVIQEIPETLPHANGMF
jgi:predicted SnoaL-like aldol condensation-catalyzing enzyme